METQTGSATNGHFLSLPCSSKERIPRDFFEGFIIEVGRGAEKGVRSPSIAATTRRCHRAIFIRECRRVLEIQTV
jgi:hypothetical protein